MDDARDLGQHLLVDDRAIARVVKAAALVAGETAFDAGAGAGALTLRLAEAVGPDGRVVAVEVDPAMVAALRTTAPPQVMVVEGDLLATPLPEGLDAVVANPPFRIAVPFLERILAAEVPRAVLVLPRELVDRLVAPPGSARYGKLTVRVALGAHVDDLGYLTRHAFDPPPNVVCGIARLRPRRDAPAFDAGTLARVLDVAWEAWERKAKHALAPLAAAFRADTGGLTRLLAENAWSEARTGALPPEAFAAVARHLGARRRSGPRS